MTQPPVSRQVDLSELARPRRGDSAPLRGHSTGVRWLTRVVLPLVLLSGFAGVLAYSVREVFVSAKPVRVVPVMAVRADISAAEGPLFQSAGWVEPRPTP